MAALNREEAIDKLRVERHRLATALDRFYSHDPSSDRVALESSALDVVIPIRVMVHHVPDKGTISLLSQIDLHYWGKPIHFSPLITPKPQTSPSGVHAMSVSIPVKITFGKDGTLFTRYKGSKDPNSKVPVERWWNDVCWDSGNNKVSNKNIVLAIANKEGGAHVDSDLAANYRTAKNQGHIAIGGNPVSDLARLGNLAATAGDELLEYLQDHFPECCSDK